jgi:hypothetical protein
MKQFVLMSVMTISSVLVGVTSHARLVSEYTSIAEDDCKVVDQNDAENGYYDAICPGLHDYKVHVSGGDDRYSVSISYGEGEPMKLTNIHNFHGPNSDLVEWLIEKTSSGSSAKFLIHGLERQTISEDGDLGNENLLFVSRLAEDQTCTIAIVRQQQDMNAKARDIANDAGANPGKYPCVNLDEEM